MTSANFMSVGSALMPALTQICNGFSNCSPAPCGGSVFQNRNNQTRQLPVSTREEGWGGGGVGGGMEHDNT